MPAVVEVGVGEAQAEAAIFLADAAAAAAMAADEICRYCSYCRY